MSVLTYIKLGGIAVLLIATALIADANGANRVIARDARTLKHATDAMQRAQKLLNFADDHLNDQESARRETVREIYLEVPKLIDRPVYHSVCGDDDGVRLLDRAAAAANGVGGPQPSPGASQSPGGPAQH